MTRFFSIKYWVGFFVGIKWISIASYRIATGRFFILRDAPLFFVMAWAREDEKDDKDSVLRLKSEARSELILRVRYYERLMHDLAVGLAELNKTGE